MLKLIATLLVLASASLAQSSSDGSFSVQHSKQPNFSLSAAQMREAESLYKSACEVVQREFHAGSIALHPRFKVIIGADTDEVYGVMSQNKNLDGTVQIRLKEWNPMSFAQGVVVIAFDQMLTTALINQLGSRAVRYSGATLDVAGLK
jgi:hypothetical protein